MGRKRRPWWRRRRRLLFLILLYLLLMAVAFLVERIGVRPGDVIWRKVLWR
jgi:hypothetical protein